MTSYRCAERDVLPRGAACQFNSLMEQSGSMYQLKFQRIKDFLMAIVICFLFLLPGFSWAKSTMAYVRNDMPGTAYVSLGDDGATFGGGSTNSPSVVLAPTKTLSQSRQTTNDNGVRVIALVDVYDMVGGGGWSKYMCLKYSTTSYAHAATQPCSQSVAAGVELSTPVGVRATTLYVILVEGVPPQCSGTVSWGAGYACSAPGATTPNGGQISITNTALGATGSGTAVCTNATWVVNATCAANLAAPQELAASQGTISGKIQVNWGAVPGATGYEANYRPVGATAWTSAPGVSSGWQLSTSNEAVHEFRIRATNAVGAGDWVGPVTGFVRPQIMPVFVSQVIPAAVRVGAAFSATQIWKNVGYTSWSGSTFQLVQATDSGSFGAVAGTFPSPVNQDQTGTSALSLTAPALPGTYVFSRQFVRSGVSYGAASTPVQIVVWGDPTCEAVAASSPITYDTQGKVVVGFRVNDQARAAEVTVWNAERGSQAAKVYVARAVAEGFKVEVPLAEHSGFGVFRIKVEVSNAVSKGSCEGSFELGQLAMPTVELEGLVGAGGGGEFVVATAASDAFLRVSVLRTEDLPVTLEVLDGSGAIVGTASAVAGAKSVNVSGARWAGDAWSRAEHRLRVRYSDTGAASQGMVLERPLLLVLSPAGSTLALSASTGHPLTATTALRRGSMTYDAGTQGAWVSKVSVQGGSDLDEFKPVDGSGSRSHALNYDQLYDKTLLGTARAVPPPDISLVRPIEVTSSAKAPVLPVRQLAATDGSYEDFVRVTWDVPAAGGTGFTYDVYRNEQRIDSGKSLLVLDDTPPVRGEKYTYRVVAVHSTVRSANDPEDAGFMPACRAQRLIGASLNADMSRINGLVERWECLPGSSASARVDTGGYSNISIDGISEYRSFSYPVDASTADGAHVLHLRLISEGVDLNADRTYEIPFRLNRASIAVNSLGILYNGATALQGVEATSIGRFGVKMDGGTGIGFAEELK